MRTDYQALKLYDRSPKALIEADEFNVYEALMFLSDEGIITDFCNEYGEPGYTLASENGYFALGNWWCELHTCEIRHWLSPRINGTPYRRGRSDLHSVDVHYRALFEWMEENGVETAFNDEWWVDYETGKAWRTQADSYSWQPSIVFNEDICEYMTPDDDIDVWIEWAANDPHRCLFRDTWSDEAIQAKGFEEVQCDYANGWYPGQNDNPEQIDEELRRRSDGPIDVMFQVSDTGQFDIHFCVWRRWKCPECDSTAVEIDTDGNTCNDCGHEWGQEDEHDADDEA